MKNFIRIILIISILNIAMPLPVCADIIKVWRRLDGSVTVLERINGEEVFKNMSADEYSELAQTYKEQANVEKIYEAIKENPEIAIVACVVLAVAWGWHKFQSSKTSNTVDKLPLWEDNKNENNVDTIITEAYENESRQELDSAGLHKEWNDYGEAIIKVDENEIKEWLDLADLHKKLKNYDEAIIYYTKAARYGSAVGQYNLGVFLANGYGVEQDYPSAIYWYYKAAEQEYVKAQLNLGYCYYYGKGVEKDYAKSVEWYRLAAQQGEQKAQKFLRKLGETW